MEVFEQAIAFTLRWEGGISSDPDDFGNAGGNITNLGITQPTLDEYCYLKGLPLKSTEELTRSEAIDIYRTLYWSRAGCSDMPLRMAIAVFDWAVNCGVGGAIGDLQRCLGCPIDGGYGPITSKALKDYLAVYGEEALLEQYLAIRKDFYDHGQLKYREGWNNRLLDLRQYLQTISEASTVAVNVKPNSKANVSVGLNPNTPPTIPNVQLNVSGGVKIPGSVAVATPAASRKKGGRVDLRIERDTWLKQSTAQASDLPPEQKFFVQAGTILPVLAWQEVELGHMKITLDGKTLKWRNTWLVYLNHTAMKIPKPEAQTIVSFVMKPKTIQNPIKIIGLGVVDLNEPVRPETPNFHWYELTHGGERLPPTEEITWGMIRIARLAQKIRDEVIKHSMAVTSGYRPPEINQEVGGALYSRHTDPHGDALDFVVDGFTGEQLYQMIDSSGIAVGGLGQYFSYPYLCHIDGRPEQEYARWTN